MTTARRIAKIVEPHGFVRHEEPGFVGWHRVHQDGRKQLLHVFFWNNPKVAAADNIPHAYIVVIPTIDAPRLPNEAGYRRHEDARFRIATKGLDGTPISWASAASEFARTVIPILDAPVPEARCLLEEANRKAGL